MIMTKKHDDLEEAFGLKPEVKHDNKETKNDDGLNNDKFDDDILGDEMDIGPSDFGGDFGGGGGEAPLAKHKDLLKDLTNFDPYLRETVNNWLGLTWDEESGKSIRNPAIRPIMNLQGAMWCIGFLKTYTRGNNIITDLGTESYKYIMMDVIDTIWLGLGTKATKDFGIQNSSDLLRIANELEHATKLVLEGSESGRYNKFLSTTYSHHSTDGGSMNNSSMQQNVGIREEKDKGFVGKLKKGFFGS